MISTNECLSCGSVTKAGNSYCDKCVKTNSEKLDDLTNELSKSLLKKKKAQEMLRHQKRLKAEWVGAFILFFIVGVVSLMTAIMREYPFYYVVLLIVAIFIVLVMLKITRYSSFDLNLQTIPRVAYKIDLIDVPDSYICQLRKQIEEIKKIIN